LRILLILAGFLTPVVAGRLQMDTHPTASGWISGLKAVFEGAAAPSLALLLIAIPLMIASFGWHNTRLPRGSGFLLALIGVSMLVALGFSQFKYEAAAGMLPWLVAGVALILASGDDRSNLVLGLFLGCLLLAVLGIHEYMLKVKIDPSWRIYSLWFNPNALASMLGIGVWASTDVYNRSGQKVRPFVLLAAIAILAAFLLTQSKGAFLMMGLSVIAYILAGLSSRQLGKVQVVSALLVSALCAAVVLGLPRIVAAKSVSDSAFARVAESSAESVQSIEYRKQLALAAIDLTAKKPTGTGMGTYRHVGGSVGRVQPAHQTHNSWLQLAVEGGVAAPILLAFLTILIIVASVKKSTEPTAQLVAAAAFVALHGLIESNLFVPGVLIGFAMVLGTLGSRTSLANFRRTDLHPILAVVAVLALGYVGASEYLRSRVRGIFLVRGHPEEECVLLRRLWPWEPEGWALSADAAHNLKDKRQFAERAYEFGPHSSNALLLAQVGQASRDFPLEIRGCLAGLQSDPNDPDFLLELMNVKTNAKTDVKQWAYHLVSLENSTYLNVTPLPDLVVIHPALARIKLAEIEPEKARDHLMSAMDRLIDYAKRTIPRVVAGYQAGDFSGYAGENGPRAGTALRYGLLAAKRAAATGDPKLIKRAKDTERAMRDAEAKLRTVLKFGPLKV